MVEERLRILVKAEIHGYNQCKRYRIKPLAARPTSALPKFRTQEERAVQTLRADFAGPIMYKVNKKTRRKSYVALYTCATTRAVYWDLLTDMTAKEFKTSLGEFIARTGNPDRIVSDNGKTFIATAR